MFNSNASSADSGGVNYIEDVFSTYLYNGTGSAQDVINQIDLSTKGGLVWVKGRSVAGSPTLYDTARGVQKQIFSDSTSGTFPTSPASGTSQLYAFNNNGFSLGADDGSNTNTSAQRFTSWTFRKQPKFFDVVTYTGNATAGRTVAHSLGSVPGCIIVKRTDTAANWIVYHNGLNGGVNPEQYYISLNLVNAEAVGTYWNDTAPTSTDFTLNGSGVNISGGTYVAYVFAHNAGGFGLTGTDNVVSCGGYTGTGSAGLINLGYEPQWLLIRERNGSANWFMFDNMRGVATGGGDARLLANDSAVESSATDYLSFDAAGFNPDGSDNQFRQSGVKYIYVAIRRGPMKVPTDGTTVFSPISSSATTGTQLTTGFRVDSQIIGFAPGGVSFSQSVNDRLRGVSTNSTASGNVLGTATTAAEGALGSISQYWDNTGFQFPPYFSGQSSAFWSFQRAPSFFDQVCYAGTGSAAIQTHNLQAVPEMMIMKKRDSGNSWAVYHKALANTEYLIINTDAAKATGANYWNSTTPTSSVFTVGTASATNDSGGTFVSYLFATCSGVSKVGSYTGTGTTLQINCGFTAGSRFVLIKRTDSTGDWYVWDSARGIVAGNDPYLLLNSNAAQVTSTDYVDTYAAGFELTSTAPAAINASGGSYIFLAIA